MKYMLQVRFNGADTVIGRLPAEEQQNVRAEFEAIRQSSGVLDGNQLQAASTAATVRVDGGQTQVTEGPAVEAGTQLDGYYIYDAARPRRGGRARGTNPRRPVRRHRRGTPDDGALAMAQFPAPREGILVTHFIVSSDVGCRRGHAGSPACGRCSRTRPMSTRRSQRAGHRHPRGRHAQHADLMVPVRAAL